MRPCSFVEMVFRKGKRQLIQSGYIRQQTGLTASDIVWNGWCVCIWLSFERESIMWYEVIALAAESETPIHIPYGCHRDA